MRPRRGLARDVYRAARSLTRGGRGTNRSRVGSTPWWSAGGSHTAGSLARKRRVQRAAASLRRFRRSKRMKMTRPRSGGGGSMVKIIKCSINHRPQSYPRAGTKPDYDVSRGAGSCVGATGGQGVTSRVFFGGNDDGGGTNIQKVITTHGGSITNPAQHTTLIQRTSLAMDCVSACNNTVSVEVYILKCQRDVAAGAIIAPSALWSQMVNAYNFPNAQPPNAIDEKPTNQPGFGSWWKIIRKTRVVVNPGQSFKVRIGTKEMWCPTTASLQASPGASFYGAVRGRSYAVMFVTKGMPVGNSEGNGVNYGPSKINFAWTWRVISSRMTDNTGIARSTYSNALDPVATINTPPQLMNDDAGLSVSYVSI